MIPITIQSQSINDPANGIVVTRTNLWSTPRTELNLFGFAQEHGSISTYQRFKQRDIFFSGHIYASSRELFEQRIDTIKQQASDGSVAVQVGFPAGSRTWTARLVEIDMKRDAQPDFINFRIRLIAANPIGRGSQISGTDVAFDTVITNPHQVTFYTRAVGDEVSNWRIRPTFTITATISRTQGSTEDHFIKIGNRKSITINTNLPATGQTKNEDGIAWPASGAAVLVMNSVSKLVTLNGNRIKYDGLLPDWIGSDLSHDVTFTTNGDSTATGTFDWSFFVEHL